MVLSDTLSRRLFPGEDPVGKRLRLTPGGPFATVAGVAGDVKNAGLSATPDPEYYAVRRHSPDDAVRRSTVIIRTPMNPRAMAGWLRSELSSLDPTLPVSIETMSERLSRLAQRPRFNATLLGLFAAMGVTLAAIGLYGIISFLVAQRTQEIGVRMALGATRGEIARLVLSHAARWTVGGAVAGVIGSLFATRWLRTMLYETSERDPLLLASGVALLLVVALLAAWVPSRRASRLDPMKALRQD